MKTALPEFAGGLRPGQVGVDLEAIDDSEVILGPLEHVNVAATGDDAPIRPFDRLRFAAPVQAGFGLVGKIVLEADWFGLHGCDVWV